MSYRNICNSSYFIFTNYYIWGKSSRRMEDRSRSRDEPPKLPRKSNVIRKKKFRKLQRGGKGKNKVKNVSIASGNLKILHSNLRGFLWKKTSLVDNVKCTNLLQILI